MLRIWQWCRATGGGMGGLALPEAGGPLDQAAAMMDALGEMERTWAALHPEPSKGKR